MRLWFALHFLSYPRLSFWVLRILVVVWVFRSWSWPGQVLPGQRCACLSVRPASIYVVFSRRNSACCFVVEDESRHRQPRVRFRDGFLEIVLQHSFYCTTRQLRLHGRTIALKRTETDIMAKMTGSPPARWHTKPPPVCTNIFTMKIYTRKMHRPTPLSHSILSSLHSKSASRQFLFGSLAAGRAWWALQ